MPDDRLELVRRVYADWSRGDFSAGDAFDSDVEFEMVDWPEAANARGIVEMRRVWGASLRAWDAFRAEATEYIDAGSHVVVMTHVEARGKGSAAEVSADTATVWTVDGGKVTRLALYWDRSKALEAVGLANA
jgi:ketosteroid isomerase-like protein